MGGVNCGQIRNRPDYEGKMEACIAFSMVSGVSPVTLSSTETRAVLEVAAFLTHSLRKCEEKVSPGNSLTCVEAHPDV